MREGELLCERVCGRRSVLAQIPAGRTLPVSDRTEEIYCLPNKSIRRRRCGCCCWSAWDKAAHAVAARRLARCASDRRSSVKAPEQITDMIAYVWRPCRRPRSLMRAYSYSRTCSPTTSGAFFWLPPCPAPSWAVLYLSLSASRRHRSF